ncbi:CAMK/CAMKL protein kinase [Sphaeroforma arctica JP610]|uniref:CAMK/CAMKL protein kinase n=1 Tax=Sphaeroforma arctica JP610 TaxID=667725 RepID=A0A0L0GEJ0_9EUKA|nr:CAMK/CAMKL protein kinase [Sphaeroforma arctica JP610]KNC87309.1 CAMK/CAMKL protein kinase [Sphaeroforma arctica JP610]|eukprot:XP_014161211.1 CAMK/CAMKL protein kinase [Sphaeroforma arctica JP610]
MNPITTRLVLREKETMKRVQGHPYIVKLFEIFEDDKNVYLVLEYIEGINIKEYLKEYGAFSESRAAVFLARAVLGIMHCHKSGVVHRDISLNNIMVTSDDNPKIVDFGLSAMTQRGPLDGNMFVESCGSAFFTPPEVYAAKYGVRYEGEGVDVWALGVVLHVLVSNRLPFNGRFTQCRAGVGYKPPRNASEDCKDLLLAMISSTPDNRITLAQVLRHPFIAQHIDGEDINSLACMPRPDLRPAMHREAMDVLANMYAQRCGGSTGGITDTGLAQYLEDVETALARRVYNHVSVSYHMVMSEIERRESGAILRHRDNERRKRDATNAAMVPPSYTQPEVSSVPTSSGTKEMKSATSIVCAPPGCVGVKASVGKTTNPNAQIDMTGRMKDLRLTRNTQQDGGTPTGAGTCTKKSFCDNQENLKHISAMVQYNPKQSKPRTRIPSQSPGMVRSASVHQQTLGRTTHQRSLSITPRQLGPHATGQSQYSQPTGDAGSTSTMNTHVHMPIDSTTPPSPSLYNFMSFESVAGLGSNLASDNLALFTASELQLPQSAGAFRTACGVHSFSPTLGKPSTSAGHARVQTHARGTGGLGMSTSASSSSYSVVSTVGGVPVQPFPDMQSHSLDILVGGGGGGVGLDPSSPHSVTKLSRGTDQRVAGVAPNSETSPPLVGRGRYSLAHTGAVPSSVQRPSTTALNITTSTQSPLSRPSFFKFGTIASTPEDAQGANERAQTRRTSEQLQQQCALTTVPVAATKEM